MKREAYHESQIDEAVAEWETRCGRGENVPLSEFCVDYPTDIREEVARRVRALESIDLLLAAAKSDKSQQADTDEAANREFPIELPRMLGRYQLLECVGQGGCGQVWRGRDTKLERDVAVKIPRPDRLGSVHQAKKFLKEARKVAKLDHLGIVPVFDYGQQGAYYYIVSKWIDGPSLAKYLSTERPTPAEAARIVSEVADALHHAHLRDLVHRDIKPGNILLETHGKAYVTDFGIAVTKDELLEEHGGVSGTIGYMAPEQAAGESHRVTPRTDIYSLGVVLYELLTGSRPFLGGTAEEVCDHIERCECSAPKTSNQKIPQYLEAIIQRCLKRNPDERFHTAKELADALRSYRDRPREGLSEFVRRLANASAGTFECKIVDLQSFHP